MLNEVGRVEAPDAINVNYRLEKLEPAMFTQVLDKLRAKCLHNILGTGPNWRARRLVVQQSGRWVSDPLLFPDHEA